MDRGAWCKITNKLTIDVGINYYLNRKDKTASISHTIHRTSYRWIKTIKQKSNSKALEQIFRRQSLAY